MCNETKCFNGKSGQISSNMLHSISEYQVQWNFVNPDTINPNVSPSRKFFWGTKNMKIY
jgi:hypothetical protein